MSMRSKLFVFVILAGGAFAQTRLDSHSKMHLTFPEESPVSVVEGINQIDQARGRE